MFTLRLVVRFPGPEYGRGTSACCRAPDQRATAALAEVERDLDGDDTGIVLREHAALRSGAATAEPSLPLHRERHPQAGVVGKERLFSNSRAATVPHGVRGSEAVPRRRAQNGMQTIDINYRPKFYFVCRLMSRRERTWDPTVS